LFFLATFPQAASKWNDWINEAGHILIKVNTVTLGQSQPEAIGDTVQQEETKPAVESRSDEVQTEDEDDGHTSKKQRGPLDFGRIRDNITQTLHVCSAHKKPRKVDDNTAKDTTTVGQSDTILVPRVLCSNQDPPICVEAAPRRMDSSLAPVTRAHESEGS
jgi:hypothetical protein